MHLVKQIIKVGGKIGVPAKGTDHSPYTKGNLGRGRKADLLDVPDAVFGNDKQRNSKLTSWILETSVQDSGAPRSPESRKTPNTC
jgi:hypothetical protein